MPTLLQKPTDLYGLTVNCCCVTVNHTPLSCVLCVGYVLPASPSGKPPQGSADFSNNIGSKNGNFVRFHVHIEKCVIIYQ